MTDVGCPADLVSDADMAPQGVAMLELADDPRELTHGARERLG